ncbi:MAG: CHAT domain-containing protein [Saprospiraceae bacterium]|nr:CHAT domain-containing protein [Saprospiraceae bacterium]
MKYFLILSMSLCLSTISAQTVDSMAIKQVDSLIKVSRELIAKRNFDKALELNELAEKIALEKYGRESALYGKAIFTRGTINSYKGNNQEALKLYLETISILENVLGREHPEFVSVLINLGTTYMNLGNYEKAEQIMLEAKEIGGKVLGTDHPEYAKSLNNLGNLYLGMGNYEKGESIYLEAKNIWGKILGHHVEDPNYFNYIGVLVNLGSLYMRIGKYEKSELFLLDAKDIFENKLFNLEHPFYINCLNNLAGLYWDTGKYEKAEELLLKAKAIYEKVLGKEHPNYANCLNNLATLYLKMGNFEKAEALNLDAVEIWGKALGKDHPQYAMGISNLASIYIYFGNYEKAEQLYLEATEINKETLGKEHPAYATNLNALAKLYIDMGYSQKAEPLYLEAKDIWGKALGKEHPDYAVSLNNLAILYMSMGNYEKTEPLYLEAKDIWGKALGKEHPLYGTSLNNLAILYMTMGNYEKAEPLYLEAKDIWGKVLGNEHPDYTQSITYLATLYEKQTRYIDAEPFIKEALSNSQSRLINATSFLSEHELAKYAATFKYADDLINGYLYARQTNDATLGMLPKFAFDNVLFYKGFLLTAASRLNSPSMAPPETMETKLRLRALRRRLAAEYTKPIIERKDLPELEQKAYEAEKALARLVAGYADNLRQVSWEEVKAVLKQSEAAIEFVHFKVNFPSKTDSTMYAVLLLRPGVAQPLFIPLFEEKELDHLLNADKERKADYVNELYAWADRGMVQLGSAKKSLYDLIWSKINEAGLEGIETIYYSPSGVLHRLNLGAIAINDEAILSDQYNLVALNSTRQLVIPSNITTKANEALLVGGVNFEVEMTLPALDDQPLLASRSASEVLVSSGTRGGSWSYLKWTEKEVERIVATIAPVGYQVDTLYGSNADEETIKAIGLGKSSPRVLHIATHGFFFPDPEAKIQEIGLDGAEPVFKSSDNPMIRSGLILAGGNYAWQNGRAVSPDREDGILTAYEISQMNLSNTELVVLSACETGLGDIQGNEGIYGLQRAFKIAGAKYLIMSLWQVPDRETMEFMTAFYKNWLESNKTIPDAFRKTQREMRDRFFNPYSWAGFVLVE